MNLYEKLNRLDDSLSEGTAYSYLVYAESGSTDEEGLFDDLGLAKKLAKKIAVELSEKDPGAYVLIKRGRRGSDVVNDTWKVVNRVKYDPKNDSFEFNTPQTAHPLYGMIDENLSELDNSLVESKRVVKKKKLTESTENSNIKYSIEEIVFNEFESGHVFADDYESFKSLIRDEGLRATPGAYKYYQELHELGPAGFYEEFKDKFEFDPMFVQEYANVDDDVDETDYIESVKGFKLYDNVVTETGHKGFIIKFLYTDQDDPVAEIKRGWMDSSPIRSYVSKLKHIDNIDEMLTESGVFDDMQDNIEVALETNDSLKFIIEPASNGVLIRFLEGDKNSVLRAVDKLDKKGFDISPAGQEFDFNFVIKGFKKQNDKQLTI